MMDALAIPRYRVKNSARDRAHLIALNERTLHDEQRCATTAY